MEGSFRSSGDFCHLLITFANNFDTGQDRQNIRPDLDPYYLFLKEFWKKSADDKKYASFIWPSSWRIKNYDGQYYGHMVGRSFVSLV